MKRDPEKTRAWQDRSRDRARIRARATKRTKLRRVSTSRAGEGPARRALTQRMLADQPACVIGADLLPSLGHLLDIGWEPAGSVAPVSIEAMLAHLRGEAPPTRREPGALGALQEANERLRSPDELADLFYDQARRCSGRSECLHELRKRSAGGSILNPANCLPVCASCNEWVERYPEIAHQLGLVIREGDPGWDDLGRRADRTHHVLGGPHT